MVKKLSSRWSVVLDIGVAVSSLSLAVFAAIVGDWLVFVMAVLFLFASARDLIRPVATEDE